MDNIKIYKLLNELDKLGTNKEYELLIDKCNNYSITDPLEIKTSENNIKEKVYDFMKNNYLYLSNLKEEGYIKIIGNKNIIESNAIFNDFDDSSFPIITSKGFLYIVENNKFKCFLKDIQWLINSIIGLCISIIAGILIYIITK